jgi:hypothetical protein
LQGVHEFDFRITERLSSSVRLPRNTLQIFASIFYCKSLLHIHNFAAEERHLHACGLVHEDLFRPNVELLIRIAKSRCNLVGRHSHLNGLRLLLLAAASTLTLTLSLTLSLALLLVISLLLIAALILGVVVADGE